MFIANIVKSERILWISYIQILLTTLKKGREHLPSDSYDIKILGTMGTKVSLLGVDQSVHLQSKDNILTSKQVNSHNNLPSISAPVILHLKLHCQYNVLSSCTLIWYFFNVMQGEPETARAWSWLWAWKWKNVRSCLWGMSQHLILILLQFKNIYPRCSILHDFLSGYSLGYLRLFCSNCEIKHGMICCLSECWNGCHIQWYCGFRDKG